MNEHSEKPPRKLKDIPFEPSVRRREIGQGEIDEQAHFALRIAGRELESRRELPKYLHSALLRFVAQYHREAQGMMIVNLVNKARNEGLSLSQSPARGLEDTAFTKVAEKLGIEPATVEFAYYKALKNPDLIV